jgi:HlyD family secretion protein/macrolide-specific efflux system membrane fusion protein
MWEGINKKKWAAGLALLLAISGGSLYYYQSVKSKTAAAVETVAVTKGTIVSSVSATGTVRPINSVDISSQITALIKEIKVKENDVVKAGQTLVILDDKALETTLQEAQYSVNSTAAKYKRAKYLNSIGAKSDADFEDTLLNYQNAKAAYDEAQSNLAKTVLVSPMDGVVLGQPVSVGTLVTAGVSDPTVIMMIGDVSQKKVKVMVDETDIGKITVGQQATFTVDAYQNHNFTGRVTKIGQISTNTTSVSSSTTSSTTSSSSSSSSASSSTSSVVYYYVTLSVDDPDDLLKTEMTARVSIKVGEKADALLIPLAALKTSTNGQYVMVLRANGSTDNVPVTVGLTSNDKVEVVSGLEEGDKLVISYTKSESQNSSKQKDNGPPPI